MVSLITATTALNLNQEMTDLNYKKYSLEQLSNWLHDALSCGEATPQEIYDVIRGVVEENYYTYKHQTSQAYELLALLNGNGRSYVVKEDKVIKWQLPVEIDGPSGEYFVMFPDDLLEAANLKEGDSIEWVDNNDGSYILRKVGEC